MTSQHGPVGMVGVGNMGGELGYGDVISNRVVDAYGDLAGGVRVADAGPGKASAGEKED